MRAQRLIIRKELKGQILSLDQLLLLVAAAVPDKSRVSPIATAWLAVLVAVLGKSQAPVVLVMRVDIHQ